MAAGRIPVRLGKTSWPPGRGSTAGQIRAPRGSGWGQRSLGQRHAWPVHSVLPIAGDLVAERAQGRRCAQSALAAPREPRGWSIRAASPRCLRRPRFVSPRRALVCRESTGGLLRAPRKGGGTPQPFGDGQGSCVPTRVR